MSIQALAWVFEQDIPSRAKNVLFALANHADHVTGHCFPSIATIMKEASCSRRATFNYLGALRRNGFIDIRQVKRADGRLRSNDYWLIFDRAPEVWTYSNNEAVEENSIDESEDQANDEFDGALRAPYQDPVEIAPEKPAGAPSQSNPCTTNIEPSDSNLSPALKDTRQKTNSLPKENSPPTGFQPWVRADEQARLKAAEEARKPQRIPVIEGSKPWEAHVRAGHKPTLTTTIEVNGKRHRGWYFPTLYPLPKQSTGPPPLSPLMTPEDEEYLSKKWG